MTNNFNHLNLRKVAVVTGSRAEYGLLSGLMREIENDPDLELQVVVTGMHLSPEFGMTAHYIEADSFTISGKVEMLVSSNTATGIVKSMGLGLIGFADEFARLRPDIVLLLGDRFEILAAAQAALIHKIPVTHIHGGEITEGSLDDSMRHAITKLSHLHFVAAEPYRKRVIQLGEHPDNVFNVGAIGLERILEDKLYSKEIVEKKIGVKLGKLNFLVTFHPTALGQEHDLAALQQMFKSFDYFKDAKIFITKSNADEGGRVVNLEIDRYVKANVERVFSYTSLGDTNFLSLLRFVDVMIGNSSSGIIEAPYFGIPTINIGDRQKNRLRASSIVDCNENSDQITAAIKSVLSSQYKKTLEKIDMPYRSEETSIKIKNIIKSVRLQDIVKKKFFDLNQ